MLGRGHGVCTRSYSLFFNLSLESFVLFLESLNFTLDSLDVDHLVPNFNKDLTLAQDFVHEVIQKQLLVAFLELHRINCFAKYLLRVAKVSVYLWMKRLLLGAE